MAKKGPSKEVDRAMKAVPSEYVLPGSSHNGGLQLPPETISRQRGLAKGKAGMNFKNKPLGPDQSYEDGEMKHKNRSTSGVAGRGILGN